MPVVHETIQLLLAPPGGLVYHLLLLFALEAILGLSLGAWRRRRVGQPAAISGLFVAAAAGMLLARLILIAVALWGIADASSVARLIPPLERALDSAVVLLLVWALIPWGRYRDLSWFLPGFGLLAIAVIFALLLSAWQVDLTNNPTLMYNSSGQQTAWSLMQLLLLAAGMLGLLWRRERGWGLQIVALALLALGQVMQLASPDLQVHQAGWVRLAQVLVFPLLAVSVYRLAITDLSERTHELEEVRQDSISQITGLLYLLESGQRTIASLNMADVLDRAVREVVRLLKIELCGLVLPLDVPRGQAELAAVYSAKAEGTANTVRFALSDHPAIEHAIKRKKAVTIDVSSEHAQVKEIYVLLGSMKTGPLLIQPLLYNSSVIGALLLGNPHSQQQFSASQQKLCQALGRQVAIAIENARRYQALGGQLETLQARFEEASTKHRRIQSQLETQLQHSQEDTAHFARRLEEATDFIRRKQQNIESLAEQLQTVEQENSQFTTDLAQLEQEVQSLQNRLESQTAQAASTRAALEAQLAEASSQISRMIVRQRQQDLVSPGSMVLDALEVGLLMADQTGRVQQVNSAAARLLGQAVEEMMGKTLGQVCDDTHWQEGIHQLLGGQSGSTREGAETAFAVYVAGRPVKVRLSLLRGQEQEFVAAVALLNAPTASTEPQRARDEFIGALAQELRTPMTSITGYTDLLLGESVGIVGEMQRKFLQRIKANIERMGAMLNDLIGVTAIDSGQLHIEPEPIEVSNAIQEAINSAQAQLEEKDLRLKMNLALDMDTIEVDPNAFQQIVSNLLSNACKASPVGGEIGVSAVFQTENQSPEKSRLIVSLTDSGGGIAPEDQPRVFDRFYRAEQALIAGLGETGVGLSIVKALIEAHHGQIWVESEMGQGSTFAFSLPVAPPRRAAPSGRKTSPLSGGG